MAIFGIGKKNPTKDYAISEPDEIIGYLEEAMRKKVEFEYSTQARTGHFIILLLEIKNGQMRIQGEGLSSYREPKRVKVGFSLDRTWFTFSASLSSQDGKGYCSFPRGIRHSERREYPRCNFSQREIVKITILESLGQGTGVFGHALDVNPSGLSLLIEKAMLLETQKEIMAHASLFKPGTRLMLIKVNKIPSVPFFEVEGVVRRMESQGSKWKLVVEWKGLGGDVRKRIAEFVNSRTVPFKLVRRRRRKEDSAENAQPEAARRSPGNGPPNEGSAPSMSAPVQKASVSNASPPPESSATPQAPMLSLLSLGERLFPHVRFLGEDPRIAWHHENQPLDVFRYLNRQKPDVLLIADSFANGAALEFLQKIRVAGLGEQTRIVLALEKSPAAKELIQMKMAGITEHLVFPLEDEAAFFSTLGF